MNDVYVAIDNKYENIEELIMINKVFGASLVKLTFSFFREHIRKQSSSWMWLGRYVKLPVAWIGLYMNVHGK